MSGAFCVYDEVMKRYIALFAWLTSLVVTVLAVTTWWQCLSVPVSKLSVYDVFPLFGLVAFSLMWAHYAVGAIRAYLGAGKSVTNMWFRFTAYMVLFAILMHPGLLEYQLWRDSGSLLPYSYVAPGLAWTVILGQVALLAFLAFESHRYFKQKTWWHWVERASDVAMFLILIHAYKLGCSLLPGWFQYVWFFYGLTLALAIGYSTYHRHNTSGKWL